jgi:DNA-binding winged helix-turn-helix (wHTH) protein
MTQRDKDRFGDFELDRHTLELRRNGELVKLQQQPARVLALLIERAGDLVTREELRKAVWADDTFVDFDRGLNYCIRQIRSALGETADAPRYLETLRGRGYRFVGVKESGGRAAALPIAAIAVLVLLTLAGYVLASRGPVDAIGVAPLESSANDREWARAMHAQIVSRLATQSRTAVIDLGRANKDTRWRVEGRVDRGAEVVRVTVTLRDTRDGSVPWSDVFSGTPGDWVNAQSEMADRMAEIIRYRIEGPSAGLPKRRQRLPPTVPSSATRSDASAASGRAAE